MYLSKNFWQHGRMGNVTVQPAWEGSVFGGCGAGSVYSSLSGLGKVVSTYAPYLGALVLLRLCRAKACLTDYYIHCQLHTLQIHFLPRRAEFYVSFELMIRYEYTFWSYLVRHPPEPCIKISNHSVHKMKYGL